MTGIRTIFNSFHHFAPDEAKLILKTVVQARQPLGIFEIPERVNRHDCAATTDTAFCGYRDAVHPAVSMATLTLDLRAATCSAYVLVGWGIVSQLRAYTADEMLDLTRELTEYVWRSARVPIVGTPGGLTYLVGIPKAMAP